jgi:hypothetical protein
MVEDVQPQTIEADDGFPMQNMKFCGRAQEIMAVIQKNKPIAATSFDKDYQHDRFVAIFVKDGEEVVEDHDCNKYTYEQVYNESKKVNLVYHRRTNKGLLFFLKENMKDTYILYEIWDENNDFGLDDSKESYDILNTIIGILLGYKKKDIRAWFVMGLIHEFDMDFDNLDQRSEFIKKPEFKKRRDEIASEFETTYTNANEKLKEIRKEITVPSKWQSQLKTLEPPAKKSFFKRLFGKKTAGRKLNYKKTLRRRKH